ncbi:hypothetical protein B0H13DRAFT_2362639 [Mycena leptocephala]|nr:hypothetical protein B0H13DRAFT_2362639 [Mycena leptocephala]
MSSNNSSVILSDIVILENPQIIFSRLIAFTAMVYVGSPGLQEIQGPLRYLRPEGEASEEDKDQAKKKYPAVGLYYTMFTDIEEQAKFLFVGDIKQFCFLEALDIEASEPSWTINPCHRASVHVCCAVATSDQAPATFTAAPEQFTVASADAKRAAETVGTTPLKSVFPLLAYIPDSHRFQDGKKKPTPHSNRFCGFSGYLNGVCSALEGEKIVDRFHIEVDTAAARINPCRVFTLAPNLRLNMLELQKRKSPSTNASQDGTCSARSFPKAL